MTKPAAFQATYSDLRFIRTRKVVQVVLEAPIEQAAAIAAALGYPDPAQETWVAVARLNTDVARQLAARDGYVIEPAPEKPIERRKFETFPIGQQAAMRCQEPVFRAFLQETFDLRAMPSEEGAADILRDHFRVLSRSDIPAELWAAFDRHYLAWKAKEAA